MGFNLDDYIDVPTRIAEFRAKYPEGSLRAEVQRWPDDAFPFVVVRAEAFRSPMDEAPGIGWAQERFPGTTPYTKNSELQNAETSAWGRAIVASLAADTKKGIATAEEVRNRSEETSGAGAGNGSRLGKDAAESPAAPDTSPGDATTGPPGPPPAGNGSEGEGVGPSSPPSSDEHTLNMAKLVKEFGTKAKVLGAAKRAESQAKDFDSIEPEIAAKLAAAL